ncbi:MAG: vitamin K epoxide reductase family protein [Acidithiobacillus ferrivorans]
MLAFLGVADSSYALYQHYAPPETSSCDVNETISCTAINQSDYSVLLGMPVAGLGMAGYALISAPPAPSWREPGRILRSGFWPSTCWPAPRNLSLPPNWPGSWVSRP